MLKLRIDRYITFIVIIIIDIIIIIIGKHLDLINKSKFLAGLLHKGPMP